MRDANAQGEDDRKVNRIEKNIVEVVRTLIPVVLLLVLCVLPVRSHEGHPSPTLTPKEGVSSMNAEAGAEPVKQPPKRRVEEFPTLHPLVVHFPIMLLLLAAVLQIIALFVFKREIGWVVLAMALVGIIGAYLSSKVFHPHTTGLDEHAQRLLIEHEWYASLTLWLGIAGTLAKAVSTFFQRPWWGEAVSVAILLAAATAVSIAGHHGAELVHKEGIGPRGDFLELHDH